MMYGAVASTDDSTNVEGNIMADKQQKPNDEEISVEETDKKKESPL